MRGLKYIAYAVATVLLGHAIAFLLVRTLPDAAIVALGLEGANAAAVAAFRATQPPRDYLTALIGIPRLELGTTLDGVSVTDELGLALRASAPRFFVALGGMVTAVALMASYAPPLGKRGVRVAQFLAFVPPYVAPFVALGLVTSATLHTGFYLRPGLSEVVIVLTLSLPVTALALGQAAGVMSRLLETHHARTLLALGAGEAQQRRLLLPNLAHELLPSLQKISVALFGVLLFVEPIFGVSGLGTTALRAARRTDTDLMLGVVLVFATGTTVIALLGLVARRRLERLGS